MALGKLRTSARLPHGLGDSGGQGSDHDEKDGRRVSIATGTTVRISRRSSLSLDDEVTSKDGTLMSMARAAGDDTKPSSAATLPLSISTVSGGAPRPKCNALSLFSVFNSQQQGAEASKFAMTVRKLLGEMGATKELPKSVLTKAPDIVGFMSCQHGTVLFEEGQEPDCCFVVLQGRVQLWRQEGPECDVPWPAEEGSLSARKHCTAIASMLSKLAGREGQQETSASGEVGRTGRPSLAPMQSYGSIVASCGPGTIFGDAELLEFQPRMATAVVCSDTCEMLVIMRSDFDALLRSPILKAEVLKVSMDVQQMLLQFPFFRRLESDVQASVAEVMHFGFQRKGEVVFRQGDHPDLCYILLSGEVGIWVDGLEEPPSPTYRSARRQVSERDREVSTNSLSPMSAGDGGRDEVGEGPGKRAWDTVPVRDCGNQASRNKCHAILASLHRLHALKRMAMKVDADELSSEANVMNELGQAKQVAWLGPGKMFGELALLENQPRSATVTCLEDCAFLMIEGSDFDRVLKRAMNEAVMSLPILAEPLLKELPFFQELRPMVQQSVRHIVAYSKVKRGHVLFWQSDPPERLYILLAGQVSGWRNGESDGPSSYASRENELLPESTCEKCAELAARLAHVTTQTESSEEKGRRLSNASLDRFGQHRALLRPAGTREVVGSQEFVLREGAVFNEQALLMDEPCEVTMVCDKDCQLLSIEKVQFDRVVKEEIIRLKVQGLQTQVKRLFRGLPLFEDLGQSVQEAVPEIARYSFEPAGSLLFKEGDVAELCYIIISGEVTIWRVDEGKGDPLSPTMRSAADEWDNYREGSPRGNADQDAGGAGSRSSSKVRGSRRSSLEQGTSRRASKIEDSATELSSYCGDDDEQGEEDAVAELGMYVARKFNGGLDILPALGGLVRDPTRDMRRGAPGLTRDSMKEVLPGLNALVKWHAKEHEESKEFKRAQHYGKDGALGELLGAWDEEPDGGSAANSGDEEEEGPGQQPSSLSATLTSMRSMKLHRPHVTRAAPEAFERCSQLAAKLEPYSRCLRACAWKKVPGEPEEDANRPGETAIACLGPGSLFGEWALLNNDPRSATITCHSDCEFLVIEKCDFDRVVKQEMTKVKQEKIEFLQTYVPGMKQLVGRKTEELLNFFERKTVPWKHVFLEQGQVADGSVYFVWRGSVEFYTSTFSHPAGGEQALLPESGFRRLRVLIKGGVFGAVPMKARLPFTAVARSSPCEVLHISMERLRQLPDSVMRGLRKLLDQTAAWRTDANSFPSEKPAGTLDRSPSGGASPFSRRPMGGSASAALPSLPGQVPKSLSSKIPRPLSGKIPRPLDGKFPGLPLRSAGARHTASAPLLGRTLCTSPGHSLTWGGGLFRREISEDLELMDMQPGEVLALRARRPKQREDVGSRPAKSSTRRLTPRRVPGSSKRGSGAQLQVLEGSRCGSVAGDARPGVG